MWQGVTREEMAITVSQGKTWRHGGIRQESVYGGMVNPVIVPSDGRWFAGRRGRVKLPH